MIASLWLILVIVCFIDILIVKYQVANSLKKEIEEVIDNINDLIISELSELEDELDDSYEFIKYEEIVFKLVFSASFSTFIFMTYKFYVHMMLRTFYSDRYIEILKAELCKKFVKTVNNQVHLINKFD